MIKRFIETWRRDYRFKTVSASAVSMLIGFVFTVYNGILGIVYKSLWNGSICVYYLILASIRAVIVHGQRKEMTCQRESAAEHCRMIYYATNMVLILMNLALLVPVAVMIKGGRSYPYGLIPAIAMATYTTFRITTGIIHYRRSRKNDNILVAELRTINMIDAFVAVLTLQNTLIIATDGMNEEMQTLSAWTSAGVLCTIIWITIRSFKRL